MNAVYRVFEPTNLLNEVALVSEFLDLYEAIACVQEGIQRFIELQSGGTSQVVLWPDE